MSLAATRAMIGQKFGPVTPENVAAVLHTSANDLTKIAVLSVKTAPDRFHALTAAAELMTALALELDAHFDAMADAHAADDAFRRRATSDRCDVCGAGVVGVTDPDADGNTWPACPMHVAADHYASDDDEAGPFDGD